MPFGKHKGKELKDVPRSYLHWVWENLDIKHDELNECLESLFGDGDEVEAEVEDNEPCGNGKVIDIEKISKIWLVKMSNKYHPDRGGNHEQMIVVNEGIDLLKRLISEKQ